MFNITNTLIIPLVLCYENRIRVTKIIQYIHISIHTKICIKVCISIHIKVCISICMIVCIDIYLIDNKIEIL